MKKDYTAAELHFSKSLELAPNDARAYAERGYARLQAENLEGAMEDLKKAYDLAASASLVRQIMHNQLLVERARGNETRVKELSSQIAQMAASRRIQKGLSCSIEVERSTFPALRPATLVEVWHDVALAHNSSLQPSEILLGDEPVTEGISEDELWRRMTSGAPRRDGAYTFSTSSNGSRVYHVLFVRKGQYFLHTSMGTWAEGRCPCGATEPTVEGGNLLPYSITVRSDSESLGYMCMFAGNKSAPCGSRTDEDGEPIQSFCDWEGSERRTLVLDANTLDGFVRIVGSISSQLEPLTATPPNGIFDLELQPTQMIINACGKRRDEPYQLPSPQ